MRRWLLGILALIGTVLLGTAPVLGAMDTAFILEAKTPARMTYPSGLYMLPVLVIVAAFGLGIAYRITHPAK